MNTIILDDRITATQFKTLIKEAEAHTEFFLKNGNYRFTDAITVTRSDIAIRGESEKGTVITFDYPNGKGGNGFEFLAGKKTHVTDIAKTIKEGDSVIRVEDASGLKVGNALYIAQENDAEIRNNPIYDNVSSSHFKKYAFKEQIVEIAAIDGKLVTLKTPIAYEMKEGITSVSHIALLDDIKLSNLTVTYDLGTPNHYDFSNKKSDFHDAAAVYIEGSRRVVLEDITVKNAASHGFHIGETIRLKADELTVDGSHNKGKYGNGYGIELNEAFNNTLTDIEVYNTRHSVLFSSWHAEAYNKVHVVNTNRDINFHGGMDKFNVVKVDNIALDYRPELDHGPDLGRWSVVNGGGSEHPKTDIFGDNTVILRRVVGADRNDTLTGSQYNDVFIGGGGEDLMYGYAGNDRLTGDNGADRLEGGAGKDIIDGGAGDDRLIGGEGADTLIGGTGKDRFIFTDRNDNTALAMDTIKDFEVGRDKIDLSKLDFHGVRDNTMDKQGLTIKELYAQGMLNVRYDASQKTTYIENPVADFHVAIAGNVHDALLDGAILL